MTAKKPVKKREGKRIALSLKDQARVIVLLQTGFHTLRALREACEADKNKGKQH